jgi:hypothetical protein
MLADPFRQQADKLGKYDYSFGLAPAGATAWCHYSAESNAPIGEAADIQVAVARDDQAGVTRYEIAIPWTRLSPFAPAPGADLGLTVILNEDDGPGREGIIGWFGGVHLKEVDMVGDAILE